MLPNQKILEQVSKKIKHIPNKQGEYKRKIHYGCFLLCHKSGLRIGEAVKFDLSSKNKKGLYRIEKPKGKKERFVYVSKEVISELKRNNWKTNQTNRFNFYHFLRKIKRELNISKSIELSPHTLRRSFTTYHANSGMPLPLLQKLLGHSSIRTTALYWHDTYENGDKDIDDILAGKKWLERNEPSQGKKPPKETEQLPKIPQKTAIKHKPIIPSKEIEIKENQELTKEEIKKILPNYLVKIPNEKFSLNITEKEIDQKEVEIKKFPVTIEIKKEQILLAKIKSLEEQLKQIKEENMILKNEKEKSEAIAIKEKERADYYQQQLETIAKAFQQWQKINYYQQLEKERKTELEAKIIQTPLWKIKK